MCLKFTSFKISYQKFIRHTAGLSWVFACGASEERKSVVQEENILVLDEWTGFFSSPAVGGTHLQSGIDWG